MRKSILLISVLLISLGMVLTGCKISNDEENSNADSNSSTKNANSGSTSNGDDTLTIGTEGNYKPFSFQKKNSDQLTGYDVEVAREAAKRAGMKAKFVPTQWKSMFSALKTKRFDMVANQVAITKDRKKNYDFSIPYTYSGGRVLVKKDNTTIHGAEDLDGKVVGTTRGSNWAEYAKKAGAKVKYYGGIGKALEDLGTGRIDAALNDRLFVLSELDNTKYKDSVKAVGDTFQKTKMAFAFRKGEDDKRQKIDDALKEMKKDGKLSDISKKWFGGDVSVR